MNQGKNSLKRMFCTKDKFTEDIDKMLTRIGRGRGRVCTHLIRLNRAENAHPFSRITWVWCLVCRNVPVPCTDMAGPVPCGCNVLITRCPLPLAIYKPQHINPYDCSPSSHPGRGVVLMSGELYQPQGCKKSYAHAMLFLVSFLSLVSLSLLLFSLK